jgi:hypothetical protein
MLSFQALAPWLTPREHGTQSAIQRQDRTITSDDERLRRQFGRCGATTRRMMVA